MLDAIANALREDVGMGDITTECTIPTDLPGVGIFSAKANGVLSGLDIAAAVLALVDERLEVEAHLRDGMPLLRGMKIATVRGPIASMLTAERTALNFMQRMSGIATLTASFVKLTEGFAVKIMDTRKTAPGLRAFDKQAVRDGRGVNHRFGLDDMVLIKDNHIAASGGIAEAVRLVRARMPRDRRLQVEVEAATMQQVLEALSVDGIDIIMLDNFRPDDMARAVKLIASRKPAMEVEASGNVSEETVRDIAESGVHRISIGALTHSVKALDISFNIAMDAE
ncbi:MAG: carboxylating nicotinate-nucleotide diphosphorylase [Ignavibacteria bacterium]|nr:carboxylating nicotinate-nucleotide diphosphorylase [Ignavibacteria bacterium]